MRGSCGSKGFFGKPLPCPYDGPAYEPDDKTRYLLASVCGEELAGGPICCNSDQLEVLRDNLNEAEPLITSCPACRNNFRAFFCHFTCSSDQASFINVTSTQISSTGQTAVESLDFFVSERHGRGFFNSCKDVKVGATNGYAMDLIGEGAKDYLAFLRSMGENKPLGSPFQINFPSSVSPGMVAFDKPPRNCADNDLSSRCACVDCPQICPTLPDLPTPGTSCHVGALSCLSFTLILAYSLCLFAFTTGFSLQTVLRRREERKYGRLALVPETTSDTPLSPRSHSRDLVGASSLARYLDGEQSSHSTTAPRNVGRGVTLLDPLDSVQPRQYRLNVKLRRMFYKLGLFAASSPWATFAIVFTLMGLLNTGWSRFGVETDPVRLWVAPDSESKIRKDFFDQNFGPFYRPQQIFITSTATEEHGQLLSTKKPVLSWDHLKFWSSVEADIRALRSSPNSYSLSDVCFRPAGPEGACSWADRVEYCANAPVDCLPDFQQPLLPKYVLGGLGCNIVVSDSLAPEARERAMEWENALAQYLAQIKERALTEAGLEISYSTGISLEEEINKSTNMDVRIVVLSYLAMFFYVALTLGGGYSGRDEEGVLASLRHWAVNFPSFFWQSSPSPLSTDPHNVPHMFPRLPSKLFVGSKFTLGLFGIALVILSVASSVGLFSALGVKVTLIIAEVIPFLVLAVGVDNVFILVHELDRQNLLHGPNASAPEQSLPYPTPISPAFRRSQFDSSHTESVDAASIPLYLPPEERVARTLAKMGPSIVLSSATETLAFALGALVPMPAVRNFAIYAAGSVLLNALLQVTVFVSAMVLDLRRTEASRMDCFPCIQIPARIQLLEPTPNSGGSGTIARFIRKHYAPFILRPVIKGAVMLIFGGFFVISVISIQHIELGLDQRLALPSDSHLIRYFDDMDAYLDIGPPVYFVSHDVDITHRKGQQALCARFTTCNEFSLANILEAERKRPEASYFSDPAASWIDDFLTWLNPDVDCCRVRKRNPDIFCSPRDNPRLCRPCWAGKSPAYNITLEGLPEGEDFVRYLKQWLISPTDEDCSLGGQASYGTAISLNDARDDVVASHFRTFFNPLKSQADFIGAFDAAHRIADDMSRRTGASVFPYSLFFVFFDQYAHIVSITQQVLGLGLASVLIVTAVFLGSWRTGTIVTAVVALTVVNVMGVMGLWGISLNAISLVNLVISLGIAVEFCAHVARAFMNSNAGLTVDHPLGQERDERMSAALVDVGPSVISGITFTKLIGMCVLALTRSKLLETYYFRMWFSLIIAGALHGLVLLPVILSLAGGPGFPMQEADEEWMSTAIRSGYEYTSV
ncbi:multidrug efflux transporter AcrB transmembrane domain-containing protein [Multifurca ochricompacta]|uniref:Multidrug efflux transporter AcrB transmembrane domain-containing protein n=1 Tax=Multifurca ochricompacta TaxID=376703 RepID=A0AAD4MB47_9AGAM|nr:multidrug efflux transporter AcrB transmembrane domain-containing protein [Multifurca ochricompacta]